MGQGSISYRDQTITFPVTDDIERMDLRLRDDRRQAFSISGKSEGVLLLPFEEVTVSLRNILDSATLIRDIEAFWSYAQAGGPFKFSIDNTDTVLTALEADAAAGATAIRVTNLDGIAAGEYVLKHDLLGRNSSTNKLSSVQSKCDAVGDYAYTGTAAGALTGAAKVGTDSIKLTATSAGSEMRAVGPLVTRGKFLTFSIWYHSHTTAAWRLRITGGSVVVTGTAIPADSDVGVNWKNAQLTAFFPDEVASTVVSIENVTGGGSDQITVDAWQVTLSKQHATPWVDGATTTDTKTAAIDGFSEVVTVSTIVAAGGNKDTLNLASGLRFPFKERDALRSRRHWERCVALDDQWPLTTKLLDQDFRLRFREIP
jgi:hypothetical protein